MGICATRQDQLHTIPYSHYCEIARWALQLAGHAFRERCYLPGIHFLSPTKSFRKKRHTATTGAGASLPLLATAGGRDCLDDSWQILAKFWGEVPQKVQELLNYKVGPQTRTIAYSHFLAPKMDTEWRTLGRLAPVALWQKIVWWFTARKIGGVVWGLMVRSDEYVQKQTDTLKEALGEVEEMMSKPGNPFEPQPTGLPSPSGLALAALMAPVVLPESYSGGLCDLLAVVGGMEGLPSDFRQLVEEFRARKVGKFTLETYKQRMRYPATAA